MTAAIPTAGTYVTFCPHCGALQIVERLGVAECEECTREFEVVTR